LHCEKQKRKLVLVLPYQYTYRKYPASSSNSPINFTKLPIVLSCTYAIPTRASLQQLYSTNRYRYFGDDLKQVCIIKLSRPDRACIQTTILRFSKLSQFEHVWYWQINCFIIRS